MPTQTRLTTSTGLLPVTMLGARTSILTTRLKPRRVSKDLAAEYTSAERHPSSSWRPPSAFLLEAVERSTGGGCFMSAERSLPSRLGTASPICAGSSAQPRLFCAAAAGGVLGDINNDPIWPIYIDNPTDVAADRRITATRSLRRRRCPVGSISGDQAGSTFYAEQMQANGYGNKTFRIETDATAGASRRWTASLQPL